MLTRDCSPDYLNVKPYNEVLHTNFNVQSQSYEGTEGKDGTGDIAHQLQRTITIALDHEKVLRYSMFSLARVMERQTCRSQKPMPKGVWVRIPPRAPFTSRVRLMRTYFFALMACTELARTEFGDKAKRKPSLNRTP